MSNDPKFTTDDLALLHSFRNVVVTDETRDMFDRLIALIEPDLPPVGWVKYTALDGGTCVEWHHGDGKFTVSPESISRFTLTPAELATAVPLVEPVVVDKAALDKAYKAWAERWGNGDNYRDCLAAALRTIPGITVE